MKLSEFYAAVDAVAPKALSDEYCARYQAYDNSGILLETGDEVCGAVFSLDFSFEAIERAKALSANLIVTHHPAIYGKIGDLRVSDFEPLDSKLIACVKSGISVISAHLNLDATETGIDESLMRGILRSAGAGTSLSGFKLMHELSKGGYGRAYDLPKTTAGALAAGMEKEFSTSRIRVYGGEREITRAASFCGAGADEAAIAFAVQQGAGVVISADFKHHVLTLALESGLAVIDMTHYASENYGFEQFYKKISRSVGVPCAFVTERELL